MDYFTHSIEELHTMLVNKDITVEQLVTTTFDNIENTDKKINAFITLNKEAATKAAKELDEKGIDEDNLLSGIPVAIKDNILTKELKTTAGSKMLENFVPVYDATVMEKLHNDGAINVGKLNMDEFAMGSSSETSHYGNVHNPWDLNKVPGGSSGGSAAAVAAGEVIATLGTDTGGSVRQPAAFNGVYGFKPSYGRVSRWGVIAFSSSLDQVGILSKRVKDAAAVLTSISGEDDKDYTSAQVEVPNFVKELSSDMTGKKIAVPSEFMGEGINEDIKEVIKNALNEFEKMGATIETVSLPDIKNAVPTYFILASSEASSNLQRFDGIRYGFRASDVKNLEDVFVKTRSEGFGEEVKRRLMLGTFALSAGYYDAYFKKAAQVRTLINQEIANVFEKYDYIMGPTTPTTAFNIGAKIDDPVTMYMNDMLTIPANMAGVPAASIPAGTVDGMPVGLQIIGQRFNDQSVLDASYAYEQANKFYENKPSMKGDN
ncbi:glutamyl-tRNA(Gln) amidotransferase subunit A [Companilactobacillus sp. RD055328]|uniref:Asp-tRNA(Asn)/Glu-tRNA(Gln) amidotransferase subunit GatA n=1 Tax=Companilactobacillus sp. RD055328 TaxID=2916634 RepID=UPI001FC86960|nr:Asp-tRNA(Asn)/Glu-tRNA(Gln) amidotransferase subunit GatA [Companilactobacillus sp. RD055328]GKQ43128.1 glutamyl-tRNA(Gln) amidotransferase subunit A [Companilactobacillus sp. RD055328]